MWRTALCRKSWQRRSSDWMLNWVSDKTKFLSFYFLALMENIIDNVCFNVLTFPSTKKSIPIERNSKPKFCLTHPLEVQCFTIDSRSVTLGLAWPGQCSPHYKHFKTEAGLGHHGPVSAACLYWWGVFILKIMRLLHCPLSPVTFITLPS